MRWICTFVMGLCLGTANSWAAECNDPFVRLSTQLNRLDGYKKPDNHPEVYRDGFNMVVVLSVAQRPQVPDVVIQSIRISLQNFLPGKRAEYAQKSNVDWIYGAGPPEPRVFHVKLAQTKVDPASWVKNKSSVKAKSDNFLDTDDKDFQPFAVKPSKDAEIRGTVLATKTGVYDLIFRVGYRTANTASECRTGSIRIYQDHDE
jgi:hypothetical protein